MTGATTGVCVEMISGRGHYNAALHAVSCSAAPMYPCLCPIFWRYRLTDTIDAPQASSRHIPATEGPVIQARCAPPQASGECVPALPSALKILQSNIGMSQPWIYTASAQADPDPALKWSFPAPIHCAQGVGSIKAAALAILTDTASSRDQVLPVPTPSSATGGGGRSVSSGPPCELLEQAQSRPALKFVYSAQVGAV